MNVIKRYAIVTAVCAIAIGLLAAGTAGASRGISAGTTSTRLTSRAYTFNSPEFEAPIVCRVEYTISVHRTIAKSSGTLFGFVTAIRVDECRNGVMIPLPAGLPWHITYISFSGVLPNITSLRLQINGAAWLLADGAGFSRCLYRGNEQHTTGGGTTINELRADSTVAIPLSVRLPGSFFCPANVNIQGSTAVSPTVRITLI
jgi:hypothetical protein